MLLCACGCIPNHLVFGFDEVYHNFVHTGVCRDMGSQGGIKTA